MPTLAHVHVKIYQHLENILVLVETVLPETGKPDPSDFALRGCSTGLLISCKA